MKQHVPVIYGGREGGVREWEERVRGKFEETEFYQNFLDYRGSRSKLCMGDNHIVEEARFICTIARRHDRGTVLLWKINFHKSRRGQDKAKGDYTCLYWWDMTSMLQKFCFTIIIRKVFGNFSRLLFVDNISFNETFFQDYWNI